jgi:hypothetical protein
VLDRRSGSKEENEMAPLKIARAYARYALTALASVAYGSMLQ